MNNSSLETSASRMDTDGKISVRTLSALLQPGGAAHHNPGSGSGSSRVSCCEGQPGASNGAIAGPAAHGKSTPLVQLSGLVSEPEPNEISLLRRQVRVTCSAVCVCGVVCVM